MAALELSRLIASLPDYDLENIRSSGLSDETIALAGFREAVSHELPDGVPGAAGYIIPFFDTAANRVPFTRTRLVKGAEAAGRKYHQAPNTGQRIYLPPNVDPNVWSDSSIPLIAVEGERKALKLAQEGFATFAVTGVFSWRQRTYRFKRNSATSETSDEIVFTFKAEDNLTFEEQVAEELTNITWDNRIVYIIYDTDAIYNEQVQLAAFEFAIWLYMQGAIPYQVNLPRLDGEKTGADDFLVKREREVGIEAARAELQAILGGDLTFPQAPNLGPWILKTKAASRSRKAVAPKIARAIVASLDTHGKRFHNRDSGEFYYLSESGRFKRGLHTFTLSDKALRDMRNTTFGTELMIKGHHIGTNEHEILSEVADLYASTPGIASARPRRACFADGDTLYFQASDVTSLKLTADSIEQVPNGKGMLFYGDVVKPLDLDKFYYHFDQGLQGLWMESLKDFEIQTLTGLNKRQTRALLAAIFHLTPYLRQWRGLTLPIQQAIGEGGSGKTFLYQLRRGILTGDPSLDEIGHDIKDFVLSASHAPGEWNGDNLNEINKNIREDVQNTIARLITDPDPKVTNRALFTDSREIRHLIDCAFSITATRSPFTKPDVLQRSFIFHLRPIPKASHNGSWVTDHLRMREQWVAEHLLAVQAFFRTVGRKWDPEYRSGHRLVHFEQSILLMLQAIGVSADESAFIVAALPGITNEEIIINDPTIEALVAFSDEWYKSHKDQPARAQDIVGWAMSDIEGTYAKVYHMNNAISLGRWMKNNATVLEDATGLQMITHGNQTVWRATDPEKRKSAQPDQKE